MIRGKGVQNPSFQQRTAYHAMLLGGMAMITSALIVVGNKQTYADIEMRRIEDMKKSLAQVIHPDMHTNDLLEDAMHIQIDGEEKTIYIAKSNEKVVGVALDNAVQGYAGPISVMVGINRKGELLGARVLSHTETPGLGDKIEAEKHSWIFSFNGLSLSNPSETQWKVKKDGGYFDSFTGATITPRAVINSVKSSLEYFRSNQDMLLAKNKPQAKPQENKSPAPESDKPINLNSPEPDTDNTETETETETQVGVTLKGKSNG